MKLVERLEPTDGEPGQWLGVYITRWCQEWGRPTEMFRDVNIADYPPVAERDKRIATLEGQVEALVKTMRAVVTRVKNKMDGGARPCPFCGHHHVHTDVSNIGKGDREYESFLCPFPMAQAALAAMEGST